MVELVVVLVLAASAVLFVGVRRRRRRRAVEPYIPTYPTIELEQPYGGRDADPLNVYSEFAEPRTPLIARHGPPSRWGRPY